MLQDNLIPCLDRDSTFQQDNSSCHPSADTLAWFEERGIKVMPWPSLSPDLNPIENLWGQLTRVVFADGKSYDSVRDLKMAIEDAWKRISHVELKNLVDYMPSRVLACFQAEGFKTMY